MEDKQISLLAELADSLVYQNTGQYLDAEQKNILRQTLKGKKFSDIRSCFGLTKGYIKTGVAPALWQQLTEGLGEKVTKRNVLKVLERLHSQQIQSGSVPQKQASPQTQLNGRTALNGSVCYLKLTGEKAMPNRANSTLLNGQMRSEAEHPESKKASGGSQDSQDSTAEEFQQQLSAQTERRNPDEASSAFCLLTLMNFRNFIRMRTGGALLLSIGVLGCSFGLSWGLSYLAAWYGVTNHLAGKLPTAQLGYKVALKLAPWSGAAHYNQGSASEDEGNYERAYAEYQTAISAGFVPAYNNQARLYLLDGKYDAAVSLLQTALPLARQEDIRIRYSFFKNLGWARLEQGRLEEAKVHLTYAIKLQSEQAPAYCLLAQLLERQGLKKKALLEWENCLRFSYGQLPEEDKWMHIAQQRLTAASSKR